MADQATGLPTQAPPSDGIVHAQVDACTGVFLPACGRGALTPLDASYPRAKADPLYHRQWMLCCTPDGTDGGSQPDAEAAFDQTGFELPPWREPAYDPR